MSAASGSPPRLLIVEEDAAVRAFLVLFLETAGFAVVAAASGEETEALLQAHPVDLLLLDLGLPPNGDPFGAARPLRRRVSPCPIGLLTTGPLTEEDALRNGFAFLLPMPFDITDLLLRIALRLARPLSPVEQRQAQVIQQYFAALSARDWDALIGLCTENVVYVLPPPAPFAATVQGQAAFRAYTVETYQHFPLAQFTAVRTFALPQGLVGQYHGRWRTADGTTGEQEGAVVFTFQGELIAQIGVHVDADRLRRLLARRAG